MAVAVKPGLSKCSPERNRASCLSAPIWIARHLMGAG
jgi:hypothetical protein